jgi:D-alanyl-D-alanine carboxypeptidase (penicillin-binding protein 5/6)
MTTVVKKGAKVGEVNVADGNSKTVAAVAASDVRALMKRGEEGGVKVGLVPTNLAAPVRGGQQVGMVVVSQNGQQINRVPALAAAAVEKQAWWKKFWPF